MTALLVCWVLFPALLGSLSLGSGAVLEWASGRRLDDGLLLPAGFAALAGIGSLPLLGGSVATLGVPLVMAAALAGLVLGRPWRDHRLGAPVVAGALVLLVHGAPVLLSGHVTIAGFIKLDDPSTFLGLTDRLMQHGHDVSGLPPSTYEAVMKLLLADGYPAGSLFPMGLGHVVLGQDLAWLFQPSLAYMAAMLAMALYAMGARLVRGRSRLILVVLMAAQPALLIGYAWWGGVKELMAAALVATASALAGAAIARPSGVRALIPLAITCAAVIETMSFGGVVWALPPLAPLVTVTLVRFAPTGLAWLRGHRGAAVAGLAALAALLVAAVTLVGPPQDYGAAANTARLLGPLNGLKVLGIWPSGDFRTASVDAGATHVLLAVMVAAAALGVSWAWSRRAWGLLSYAFASAAGGLLLFLFAQPWLAGKALAIASPAAPMLALAAAAMAYERGSRIESALVAAVLASGILWSNFLQYHAVELVPHAQMAELEHVGKLVAGEGPTLMTEYNPYGARHFLRRGDPESISEFRRRPLLLRTGGMARQGTSVDIDDVALPGVLVYRSLVLRRSPVASRPPALYHLVWHGRFYELWQRSPGAPPVIEHLALGGPLDPAQVPSCPAVRRLAGTGPGALAAPLRDAPLAFPLGSQALPPGWTVGPGDALHVYPRRAGRLDVRVRTNRARTWTVWVGGSFRGRLTVSVDGQLVGSDRHEIDEDGGYVDMGHRVLRAGPHVVTLDYGGPDLHPGSAGPPLALGPVVLGDQTADRPVAVVRTADARTLCGHRLDWVEALPAVG